MGWVKEFLICFSSHLIFYYLKKLIVLEVKYNLYINKYYKFIQFIFMRNKFIFYHIYVKKEKQKKKVIFYLIVYIIAAKQATTGQYLNATHLLKKFSNLILIIQTSLKLILLRVGLVTKTLVPLSILLLEIMFQPVLRPNYCYPFMLLLQIFQWYLSLLYQPISHPFYSVTLLYISPFEMLT